MHSPALEDIQQDELAFAVARAIVVANETAMKAGISVQDARLAIGEETGSPHRLWRIHYRRR